nr:hypothetical protein B0A51_01083 [Rachicladosporium sp. CCFEE 5018]
MLEASPEKHTYWVHSREPYDLPQVTLNVARSQITSYCLATNCILDVFDETDLMSGLEAWIVAPEARSAIPSPLYYLVLAIGEQTRPNGDDQMAYRLFDCGRHTAQRFMEEASVWTVRAYSLISMYMLNACRRNAAFMYLGTAVRAAYALGLHRKEVNYQFSKDEQRERERLWKVIRILDLFMGASLGRPPSTSESRVTSGTEEDYSASNDLCYIFERILTDVYAKRTVSTTSLKAISTLHLEWASHSRRGMVTDLIDASEFMAGSDMPNISVVHLIEAYYWTIMLLTRPFLTEAIIAHANTARSARAQDACGVPTANGGSVTACVYAAVKTIDLLKRFLGVQSLPRRLPFVTNCLFVASLVLGFAHFGDLDQKFPLSSHLEIAHRLLLQSTDDLLAQHNAHTIGYLRDVCSEYIAARVSGRMYLHDQLVASTFGRISLASQCEYIDQSTYRASPITQSHGTLAGLGNHEDIDPTTPSAHVSLASALDTPADSTAQIDVLSDLSPEWSTMPRTLCFDALFGDSPFFSTALYDI